MYFCRVTVLFVVFYSVFKERFRNFVVFYSVFEERFRKVVLGMMKFMVWIRCWSSFTSKNLMNLLQFEFQISNPWK